VSGSPSEAEIRTQWRNAVRLLETMRDFADSSMVGAGNAIDRLHQDLEGVYTPGAHTALAARMRSGLSGLVDPQRALEAIAPILYEYGRILTKGGSTTLRDLFRELYDHMHATGQSIQSRGITFDTTATPGTDNVGNGVVSRLTVDWRGYQIQACHVETKTLRCVQDRNTGGTEFAEVFELIGQAPPPDSLERGSFGSGISTTQLRVAHAGSASGGSLLRNSSFDSFSSTASPKFTGWQEVSGGSALAQDTTNFYTRAPLSTTHGALRMTWGGSTITIRQALDEMRVNRMDRDTPYFLRVMVNKTVGSATGGNFVLRLGAVTVTTALSSIGSGWQEILVPIGTSCWPLIFWANPLRIEIEWASGSSGFLLVDDAIFVPWDLVDGTYWNIRNNNATPIAWKVRDTMEFTDTGGSPGTGVLQWWMWVAGLGHLPSSVTPTISDP
jgi:hypothetical protein